VRNDSNQDPAWQIWIDTGGTFTDCLGVDPAGGLRRAKVLSSGRLRGVVVGAQGRRLRVERLPEAGAGVLVGMRFIRSGQDGDPALRVVAQDPQTGEIDLSADPPRPVDPGTIFELGADEEAPILAARLITGTGPGEELPPIRMRLGTTRATNALLEGRGAAVALFVTRGFGDLLEIGTQQRPDLFALKIEKSPPIHTCVVEVPGRLDSGGHEIEALDLDSVRAGARRARESGITAAAVCLMHSWVNPGHEQRVGEVLRDMGFEHVSLSASLAPLIRILPRAQTAVVNATLSPVIDGYLGRVGGALGGAGVLHLMTSSGGLVRARDFAPKDSLLSGPAGGVVGAAAAGREAGFERTIAFDMGGTSTDVSRFDGDYGYAFEHQVGSALVVAPAMAIESVAAGGGSECWADQGLLRVGPRSAGASPGPACYGAGGPLTITDCNLILGRLDPAGFQIPLQEGPAWARLMALVAELDAGSGAKHHPDDVAFGLLCIAAERMAEAISRVSVRQGYDPAGYALVAFGGAGGQHACAVARRLGITSVVVPRDAGLLSAWGLGEAAVERIAERQVLLRLEVVGPSLETMLQELADGARAAVAAEGIDPARVVVRRRMVQVRLAGQESSLTVEHPEGGAAGSLAAAFVNQYRAMYGHEPPERAIEIESVRVVASSGSGGAGGVAGGGWAPTGLGSDDAGGEQRGRRGRAHFEGGWREVQILDRAKLPAGREVRGPSLILDPFSTTVVEPGWVARVHPSGALVLEDTGPPDRSARRALARTPAAVRDELSTGRLGSIARDMGEMLRRTALSTNVKERLDFSCAILDARGRLVVNAPHIPVHLGALGVCVRRVLEVLPLGPGDAAITNHPGFGGSHLPDITVITPVFAEGSGEPRLLAYVASRAHHAELGGIQPGSMPTMARNLAEEGVVIPPIHLVRAGSPCWDRIERLLLSGPHPSRAPGDNLADLAAQLAANQHGVSSLVAFAREHGADELARAMDALTARARAGVEAAIARLAARGPEFEAAESLDDGSVIRVRIGVGGGRAVIDFGGSAGLHPGNLNATGAIVRSAVMYVLRLLIDEPLPLNEGLLEPVELRIPRGMLNPEFPVDPALCPAVAGGNVETSQRVVDTLLKALGVCACSQGTMNNIIFGDARFGYYETVCGGAGAGPGFDGAAAVHTHMTNTRITDPEILERRYPVRLERFAIRRGSGGAGRFKGGDGVIRELVFLAPCELSVLTQHRATGPYGVSGGQDGRPGAQRLVRGDGTVEVLGSIDGRGVRAGDRLIVETPGGGGWGGTHGVVHNPS